MHYLVLATILSVMLSGYVVEELGLLPKIFKLLPEMMSAIAAVSVVIAGMVQRFRYVRAVYWLLFGATALVVLCGVIVNSVEPGPLVAGMRSYLRVVPFFFLPAVFLFKEQQLRTQLRLLLFLAFLQVPLAAYQRMQLVQQGRWSGDDVFGTLMISSALSMFLICAACVATGMFLRNRISKASFIALFFFLLIPTTINETKGTLILLPFALFTCLMIGTPRSKRLRIGLSAAGLLAAFIAIYVPIYDHYTQTNNPYPYKLSDFFTDQERLESYLDKGSSTGTREVPGRLDSVKVPIRELSKDPLRLLFGLGIGNASHSALGQQFVGSHYPVFGAYAATTSAGAFILELGMLGTLLVLALYWAIFSDARKVARLDTRLEGAVAIGWTGTVVLITFATFYKSIHGFESLSYLFWYFSGLIAARRMRLGAENAHKPASMRAPAAPPGPGSRSEHHAANKLRPGRPQRKLGRRLSER